MTAAPALPAETLGGTVRLSVTRNVPHAHPHPRFVTAAAEIDLSRIDVSDEPRSPRHVEEDLDRERARQRREASMVSTHLPSVWRFLRRLGLSPEDADDVSQETFMVAVRKLDRIEDGNERRYLFGIAVRLAARTRRSQRCREAKTAPAHDVETCRCEVPATDELLARKQAREMLDDILAAMPSPLRTAFVLFELEEMTMVEIASMTDTPVGTVASRIRRAREQFQEAARDLSARRP